MMVTSASAAGDAASSENEPSRPRHNAQVSGQQASVGVAKEREAGGRVAAEGQAATGEDHLPAGPVAVEDGQPGVLEQEMRQPDRPADAEPDRDEPGRAAGDLELEGRIAPPAAWATSALIGSKRIPRSGRRRGRRSGRCASGSVTA